MSWNFEAKKNIFLAHDNKVAKVKSGTQTTQMHLLSRIPKFNI